MSDDETPQAVCPNCGTRFAVPVVIPRDVKEWMALTTPLHIMVGDVPPGWSNVTLTNATDRGTIRALTSQQTYGDGSQTIHITLDIPPRKPRTVLDAFDNATDPSLPTQARRRALPPGDACE